MSHHRYRARMGDRSAFLAVGVVLGALGLVSPLVGAIIHNLSTVAVVLNSARLIGYREHRQVHGSATPSAGEKGSSGDRPAARKYYWIPRRES